MSRGAAPCIVNSNDEKKKCFVIKMPTKEWIESNREMINEKRRERYMLSKLKEDWPEKRAKMLERTKNAKTMCPHGKILYGSSYLKHHIANRHTINTEPPENL